MAIVASEIEMRYSGSGSQTDPDNSIGGAINTASTGLVQSNTANNDMSDIPSTEAATGSTRYRCFYFRNTNNRAAGAGGPQTYIGPRVWISAQTSSGDSSVEIGVASQAKNTAVTAIANQNTAPASVTFSSPSQQSSGLAIGDLVGPSDYRGVWIKYVLNASAAAHADTYTIGIGGDTNP